MKNLLSFVRKHSNVIIMSMMLLYGSLTPQLSHATGVETITNIMCNATNIITGSVGKSIAIIIIISLAISLFLGKVSWGLAIATLIGMGVLFGAPSIVNVISGSSAGCGS